MGQDFSNFRSEIAEETFPDLEADGPDDIRYLSPSKASSKAFSDKQILEFENDWIKRLRTHLVALTKSSSWEEMNNQFTEKFIINIMLVIKEQMTKNNDEVLARVLYLSDLEIALKTKLKDDDNLLLPIFEQTSNNVTFPKDQLFYFAIQSLISMLLISIKSAEKNDPTIIDQILSLTGQLSQQLLMKPLSSSNQLLFKSLEPLTNYLSQLSKDSTFSKRTTEILLSFAVAKGSFKDLLVLFNNLIFNTTETFNVQILLQQMNNYFSKNSIDNNFQSISWDYLKSLNIYPNSALNEFHPTMFTGQLISSIILSHIDIDNELHPSQISSISSEFHPDTFQILFHLIEQCTPSSSFNPTFLHIVTVCLRLFSSHLQLLFRSKLELIKVNDVQTWFDFLLNLISSNHSEQIVREASKALVKVINIQSSSFSEKLLRFYQFIQEKKYPIFIEQLFLELNQTEFLTDWISHLCDKDQRNQTIDILYFFLDLSFQGNSPIESFISTFQSLLLYRLIDQCQTRTFDQQSSSLIVDYLNYLLQSKSLINEQMQSILIGLSLMTNTDVFLYEAIQPIFLSVLPSLVDYYLLDLNPEWTGFLFCLIGRISQVLIIGSPYDSLEEKHANKFKLPIFLGSCILNKMDELLQSNLAKSSQLEFIDEIEHDKDFLLSIYNQTDTGAELLAKLRLLTKMKQRILQQSIEEQVNNASACLFAVYLKYYRRVNLARVELVRNEETKPTSQLLTLFEHANRVKNIFVTIKGQGGNCDELLKQIQHRTLFLLLSVRESDLISTENEEIEVIKVPDIQTQFEFHFQRQRSQWSKAKHIFKILQNLFQGCIRFKKIFLQTKEKHNSESLLNRTIENFVYGDLYQPINEEKQREIEELKICLTRQYQRSLVRLMTYQFIKIFLEKLEKKEENLKIFLPYLKRPDLDWSYFDHINTTNQHIQHQLSATYYSITKSIIPFATQSISIAQHLFSLLNLSYQSLDILYLTQNQILKDLFQYNNSNDRKQSMIFDWFQFYTLKLCQYAESDKISLQQEQKYLFQKLIFDQLQHFNQIESEGKVQDSLENLSRTNKQCLTFLLRSICFHKQVISICANIDYLEELLKLYARNFSTVVQLLVIKLLRYIIPAIPDDADGIAKNRIENFVVEIMNTISERIVSPVLLSELIYLYRTIMSVPSSWETFASELVFNSIKSYLNLATIENKNADQMKTLIGSLRILGGYVESYRLGSIVQLSSNGDISLGIIIAIKEGKKSYSIQFFENNEIKSLSIDKLTLINDVLPPNVNESILDVLGEFLSIDPSKDTSLLILQLKRRVMSIFSYLLKDRKIMKIFMNKPYAAMLAKFSRTEIKEKTCRQLKDLRIFSKQHLEQYYLSLYQSKIETEEEEKNDHVKVTIDEAKVGNSIDHWKARTFDPEIFAALSLPIQGWRPYASESEREYFTIGRFGNEELSLVPMPKNSISTDVIEECGVKHRFYGRIALNLENASISFPSFIIDNLQLTEGKWYYCVRLPEAGLVQIGWATDGYAPGGNKGVGHDRYSWCYDGSRSVFFNGEGFYGVFNNLRWKENDVCGCGIEIDGKNSNIKFWLNGKLLGTAFQHDTLILSSSRKCDLFPNGSLTKFYPSVTLQRPDVSTRSFELIVSPEDMQACPLPEGYKPLLVPKYVQTENSIVDYPLHAYLIGENPEEFLVTKRKKSKMNILRDFVNDAHLPTALKVEDQSLILPDHSDGFPLSLNLQETPSMTISFDYQILSTDEKSEFSLVKFSSTEIPWKITDQKQTCVVVFLSQYRQIKVYSNDQYQLFNPNDSLELLQLQILSDIFARMQNLAIWNYALSEEQISRLFTYGLFYIANDYQQLKEYRKRVNCISFLQNQQEFLNESLLPFDEPWTENLWKKKVQEVEEDEFKYFQTPSTVELFGNKTYLALNKSKEDWVNYTLILEFSIPQWPKTKEHITLITLNSNCGVYLTDQGRIAFKDHESSSCVQPKEMVRLFLTLNQDSLQIYFNDKLEIDLKVTDHSYHIQANHIDLFKESDTTKNTTDVCSLRLSLKSIIYLNRSISFEQLHSPGLLSPPFEIVGPSLMAAGYRNKWIEKVMEENAWKDTPRILRERKEEFQKVDLEREQQHYLKLVSKLNLSINSEDLEKLICSSQFSTKEQISDLIQRLSPYLNAPSSSSNLAPVKLELHDNWFTQSIEDFNLSSNLTEWIRDETSSCAEEKNIYQLYDLLQSSRKKNFKSIEYSHRNLSAKQIADARYACEYGLIGVYARCTISNMLKIWSDTEQTLFPLEKFGDYFIIKLFLRTETTDHIDVLIKTILKIELKAFLQSTDNHPSLFNYLQNEILIQAIQFLVKPSSTNQIKTNFILKILHVFAQLLVDQSSVKGDQLDSWISILFPSAMIDLIFYLFLLIPIQQVRISIIRLLTTLTRISPTILLSNRMQEFFIQLLIRISNDSVMRNNLLYQRLQTTLVDLVYLLLTKQKSHHDDIQSKFSESIQDLFALIDVIDIWLDPTKTKSFPETLLAKVNSLFLENYQLKQEDFQKSNIHFNYNADQELIRYINITFPLLNSMFELFEKLPTESEPNPTFYKSYSFLSLIPADCIQLRAKFIYLFNIVLCIIRRIIDFSLSPEQSHLAERIRTVKSYVLALYKFYYLNETLEKTEASNNNEWTIVNFDTVKASTETEMNSEYTWFYQAFQQLYRNADAIFRRSTGQLWHAQFLGMHSTDQGGPYRDSITRICSDLCSTRLSLFILCPNGRMNSGFNRDCWIPNVYPPNTPIDRKIQQQYRFVGQLLGMAVRKKHYLDIKFPPLFWKKLLNEPLTMEDIESIDIQSFRMINEMEKNIEQIQPVDVDNDLESIFTSIMSELHFDVVSSSGETFELLPGGSETPITARNFKEYCLAYRNYRLNEFNRQIDLIRQGLHSVIPCYYLNLFTSNELEETVCGQGRIDLELLKRNTLYGSDYVVDAPVIQRFWTVMSDMFTDEQKKLFLIFVWGRSTLPSCDKDFQSRFVITRLDVSDGTDADRTLPRAHTCFFTLVLPAYTTAEIMYERLNYAITCCCSIDADGNMNDEPTAGLFDVIDDTDTST